MKLGLLLSLFLPLIVASPGLAAEIVIGSGTSVANNVLKPVKQEFEKATGHAMIVAEIGPDAALKGLSEGKFDAAAIILGMEESKAMLKKLGLPEINLESSVLGSSKTVVILNKANGVGTLSKEQIKGLLTGKIESWKDVGGADLPVLVILGKMTGGISKFYYGTFLDGAPIPADALYQNAGADVRAAVAASPEAIGLVVASIPDGSVKVPTQPDAVSSMYLYTKGAPSPAVKQLVNFIKGPGQAYLKK